jgi:ATP-dependent Clp protease ATP-binding subunit ClpA
VLERFTAEARATVGRAVHLANNRHRGLVDTEHLLLALLSTDAGTAYTVLSGIGLTAQGVRADIERLTGSPEPVLSDDDAAALRTIGIDVEAVLARVEESFGPGALDPDPDDGRAETKRGFLGRHGAPAQPRSRFSASGRKALELSLREALRLKHNYIGTGHLLLGLIRSGDGLAMKIVADAGISPEDLRAATLEAMKAA